MREGWKCPACSRILSPDVQVCPCSEGGASVPASPVRPAPAPGTGAVYYTGPTGGGVVSTTGTAWEGVTITTTNLPAGRVA
jgi:hypothetical protein